MNILVTGASGFIGSVLCSRLASGNKVIGVYRRNKRVNATNIDWEQADMTDGDSVVAICEKYSPDVVIHCAGIAHQKIGAVDSATYMRVNSEATENLAKVAAKCSPDVRFIFLSSVSVYGEGPQINPQITPVKYKIKGHLTGRAQITQNEKDASRKGAKAQKRKNDEGGECRPSSDYAVSKLDAERRLVALSDEGIIRNLVILRLAPVYDREWSFNLDRRVVAPLNMAYMRFGSGLQRMSALARPNLVDFIEFLIRRLPRYHLPELRGGRRFSRINVLNVCDAETYEFNMIIQVLKNSGIRPSLPVISVPLPVVWLVTRIAGGLFRNKRKWFHSCYDKLASSLVFSNGKMLKTGFRPRHSLETIFSSTRKI